MTFEEDTFVNSSPSSLKQPLQPLPPVSPAVAHLAAFGEGNAHTNPIRHMPKLPVSHSLGWAHSCSKLNSGRPGPAWQSWTEITCIQGFLLTLPIVAAPQECPCTTPPPHSSMNCTSETPNLQAKRALLIPFVQHPTQHGLNWGPSYRKQLIIKTTLIKITQI